MGYKNVLVAVAVAPDSQRLVDKAISIVRPYGGKVTLVTLSTETDLCNSFAGPMLTDLRGLLQEELVLFMNKLRAEANYPIEKGLVFYGELSDSLANACREHAFDLIVCGSHCDKMVSRMLSSASRVIDSAQTDVLVVPL